MGRILSGNTVLTFVSSIFLLVIMSAIVFLSVDLVFGNYQIQSLLTLIAVILVGMTILFAWNILKKRFFT
jgi:hypothetical protein